MEQFDATAYKAETRKVWDAACPGWEASLEYFERGAAPVTARLLELAGLRPGQSVLDVATGHGEPALTAASVVVPTGRVIGVDLSPRMVEAARARAKGTDQATFAEADLEDLDGLEAGGFDAVLSRFGLMFAVDHVATFRTLARRLRPGGVLAAAVWGPPDQHLMSVGPMALGERVGLPAPAVGA